MSRFTNRSGSRYSFDGNGPDERPWYCAACNEEVPCDCTVHFEDTDDELRHPLAECSACDVCHEERAALRLIADVAGRPAGRMSPLAATLHWRYRRIAYAFRRYQSGKDKTIGKLHLLVKARAAAYDDYVKVMREEARTP